MCNSVLDKIIPPIDDTLNIKNGINFAQFLESILRIAYYKMQNNDELAKGGYKNVLQALFQINHQTRVFCELSFSFRSELQSELHCQ